MVKFLYSAEHTNELSFFVVPRRFQDPSRNDKFRRIGEKVAITSKSYLLLLLVLASGVLLLALIVVLIIAMAISYKVHQKEI